MHILFRFAPVPLVLLFAACTEPQSPPPPAPDSPTYLAPGARLDPTQLLPPPPAPGSLAQAADIHAFQTASTTAPAFAAAASLAGVRTPAFQQALSCALGLTLSEEQTPALRRLLARTSEDMRALTDPAQAHFARPRPFTNPAESCDPAAASLGPSYPSGQAATGWLWALALSDAVPARHQALLAFGQMAGDVRATCRAHWLSDLHAGRLLATALHGQLSALPAYKADVDAAAQEAKTAPPVDAALCVLEQ